MSPVSAPSRPSAKPTATKSRSRAIPKVQPSASLEDQLCLAERADAIADEQAAGVPLEWIDDWQPWLRDLKLYEAMS